MAKQLPLLKSLILKGVLYGQLSGFWRHLFLSSFFLWHNAFLPFVFMNFFLMAKDSTRRKGHIDLNCRSWKTGFHKNSLSFLFLKGKLFFCAFTFSVKISALYRYFTNHLKKQSSSHFGYSYLTHLWTGLAFHSSEDILNFCLSRNWSCWQSSHWSLQCFTPGKAAVPMVGMELSKAPLFTNSPTDYCSTVYIYTHTHI